MMTQPKSHAQTLEQTMNRLVNVARTDAVFGQPVQRDGVTVIPCSEIALGLGLGGGAPRQNTEEQRSETGEGLGGGGGVRERPVAVIVMAQDGVHVKPILNLNRIAASVFSALGLSFLWLARRNQKASAALLSKELTRARLGRWLMFQQMGRKQRKRAGMLALAAMRKPGSF
ncbi:MAG TPA: spore germination protein GerW family protein [Ktedonobacterales bacterium]|jgi:uncharacterized spore protein YtfJ